MYNPIMVLITWLFIKKMFTFNDEPMQDLIITPALEDWQTNIQSMLFCYLDTCESEL